LKHRLYGATIAPQILSGKRLDVFASKAQRSRGGLFQEQKELRQGGFA
jgi:hypothetical protein